MTTSPPTQSLFKKLLEHDTLRIAGFIADMLAIGTFLWSIKSPNSSGIQSITVSPWYAVMLWLIAVYTYICYLHSYWNKTSIDNKWSKDFSGFVIMDLIIKFRKPLLLFPFLLLIIALFSIFYAAGALGEFVGTIAVVGALSTVVILAFRREIDRFLITFRDTMGASAEKCKEKIDPIWSELKPVIEKKFQQNQWVEVDDFKELMVLRGLDNNTILYAFVKYAAEHDDIALLGNVYRKFSLDEYLGVLINISNLDDQKYEYNTKINLRFLE